MPIKLLALLSFLAPVLSKLLRWLARCRSTEVIPAPGRLTAGWAACPARWPHVRRRSGPPTRPPLNPATDSRPHPRVFLRRSLSQSAQLLTKIT